MDTKKMQADAERIIRELSVEELEEKVAPVDCAKKPDHPQCQAVPLYGGPMRYAAPF